MNQTEAPPAARVSAASALLDRGWGKPTQPVAGDDEFDPIRMASIERHIVDPHNPDSKGVQATPDTKPV